MVFHNVAQRLLQRITYILTGLHWAMPRKEGKHASVCVSQGFPWDDCYMHASKGEDPPWTSHHSVEQATWYDKAWKEEACYIQEGLFLRAVVFVCLLFCCCHCFQSLNFRLFSLWIQTCIEESQRSFQAFSSITGPSCWQSYSFVDRSAILPRYSACRQPLWDYSASDL